MYTRKITHKRLWINLLILVNLFAALLPASAYAAAGQAQGCTASALRSESAAVIAVTDATQDVTIAKDKVDQAVFNAAWRNKLTDAKQVEGMILGLFLYYSDKFTTSDMITPMQKFRQGYEPELQGYADILSDYDNYDLVIHTMLDVALDIPEIATAVPFVWQQLTVHSIGAESLSSDELIGQSARRFNLSAYLLDRSPEILARIQECAREIPEVGEAFRAIEGDKIIDHILDSADKLLEEYPDLPIPPEIRDGIEADGTIKISLNDLKALSEEEFAKLHGSIDDMQETLNQIDKNQAVILDYLKNQELKEKWQATMKKKAAEQQAILDGVKTSITVVTSLVGQIDPKVAKELNVVGNSALQVGVAVNGWLKAVSGLKGLDKVTSMSTLVLTGNVLGAVMNIVSLFGDSKPTPEQQILEEIGKLRQQVDKLRQEMHGRFDRIDAELNAIYTTMNERFHQIDIQLGKITGDIQEVQHSLLDLDLRLSRIERNNFEFLNTLGRRPLLDAINGGLGYEERTGVPMPYQPDFIAFENTLHGWGTIHVFDAVNAGPTQRDYSDSQLLAELSAYPLDSNINYLNGWLTVHGLPPLATERIASPRDWNFASRAYTQLGLEWPDHMEQINPQRQVTLSQVGQKLEAAMNKITTVQTPDGPKGNTLLFDTVISHYQGKLDAMGGSLQQVENTFYNDLRANLLQRAEPFNLYGGLDQPLTYVTPELTTATCGDPGGHGSYPAPVNLRSLIPNFDRYNLAEYLRLGSFSVCISDEWINPLEYCDPDPDPRIPPICYYKADDHKSIVTVRFNLVPIMTLTIDEGEQYMPNPGAETWTRDNWTTFYEYKAKFEAITAANVPSPEQAAQQAALLATITSKLETTLGDYQQDLYARILNEMKMGSLKPSAVELGGSKALLNAFVTLGLQSAVNSDEFLHAMLFGNQQIVDDGQIAQSYALSLTQPITGANLLVNPRLVTFQKANERITALKEMIKQYLDAIGAEAHFEASSYIAGTRRALDLTMRIVRVEEPQPSDVAITGLEAANDGPTVLGEVTRFSTGVIQGTNVTYAWNFGDGTSGTGANPTHTYGEPGVYKARVTASNSVNQVTAETEVVIEPQATEATAIAGLQISNDGPTTLGEITRFAATVSQGTNVRYTWTFGDGKSATGANPIYTYSEAGVYTARVTASNSVSEATAEVQVTVKQAAGGQTSHQLHLPVLMR